MALIPHNPPFLKELGNVIIAYFTFCGMIVGFGFGSFVYGMGSTASLICALVGTGLFGLITFGAVCIIRSVYTYHSGSTLKEPHPWGDATNSTSHS